MTDSNNKPTDIVARHEIVGQFKEYPIYDWIKTRDGQGWSFVSTIDSIDDAQLLDNQCMIYPGIVYQRISIH